MIQKNSNFFNNPKARKGRHAEILVTNWLKNRGNLVYSSVCNASEPYDFIVVKDGKIVALVDVKSKKKRAYCNDTGVDKYLVDRYRDAAKKNNLPFFLFFVDWECEKKAYFQELEYLLKPDDSGYPSYETDADSDKVYFNLNKMNLAFNLEEEDLTGFKNADAYDQSYNSYESAYKESMETLL